MSRIIYANYGEDWIRTNAREINDAAIYFGIVDL